MQQLIRIRNDSKIKSFKLISQPAAHGKIFLGSTQTNSFITVDAYFRPLTNLLNGKLTVVEIAQKFDPEISVSKLKIILLYLIQTKLIKEIDGNKIYKRSSKDIDKINSKFLLFIVLLSSLLASFAVGVFLSVPALFPKANDFYWSSSLTFCLLSAFIFTWVSLLLHEAAHLVIASANGLTGSLRISHRLNFLVVETHFKNIYSINKNGRIAIYVSGVVIDLAWIAIFYICLSIRGANTSLIRQFILLQWLSILWQFFFYMKTDFYFVIKEVLGIENLYTLSKTKILNIFKSKKDLLVLSKHENLIVNIYAIFFVVGSVIGISRYVFYHIPILVTGIIKSIYQINNGNLADGVTFIVIEGIFSSLFIYSLVKNRK